MADQNVVDGWGTQQTEVRKICELLRCVSEVLKSPRWEFQSSARNVIAFCHLIFPTTNYPNYFLTPQHGEQYYVNVQTGSLSWTTPQALMSEKELDQVGIYAWFASSQNVKLFVSGGYQILVHSYRIEFPCPDKLDL